MQCNYYIKNKKRNCKYKLLHDSKICNFHCNFLRKKKKLGLYKIAMLIKKNKFSFFTYIYKKKVLRSFFFKYCFPYKYKECSICLEPILPKQEILLKCKHSFHQGCILNYLRINQSKKKCPYCRQDVFYKESYFLQFQKNFIIRIPKIISDVYFNQYCVLKKLYKNEFLDYVVNNFNHEAILFYQ